MFVGFYSFRSDDGSHFIQALCKELSANATKIQIYSILTNVNRFIATTFEANSEDQNLTGAKQMPIFHSTLTRTLQFNDKTNNEQPTDVADQSTENGRTIESTPSEINGNKGICSKISNAFCCIR